MKWNSWGVIFAIVAGFFTWGVTIWPSFPQVNYGELGALWGIGAFLIGSGYLASVFLSERHPWMGKMFLFGGALLQFASAGFFAYVNGLATAVFIDAFPAILATLGGIALMMSPSLYDRVPDARTTDDRVMGYR